MFSSSVLLKIPCTYMQTEDYLPHKQDVSGECSDGVDDIEKAFLEAVDFVLLRLGQCLRALKEQARAIKALTHSASLGLAGSGPSLSAQDGKSWKEVMKEMAGTTRAVSGEQQRCGRRDQLQLQSLQHWSRADTRDCLPCTQTCTPVTWFLWDKEWGRRAP